MDVLSEYELQRARNIASNNAELARLGLDEKPVSRSKLASIPRKRKVDNDPDYKPEKRTTRVSGKAVKKAESDDDSSDDDNETVRIPRPVKVKTEKASTQAASATPAVETTEKTGSDACVVVEAAKTGRSKCRRCLEALPSGELRVGMESWMVGRQVMVWQKPTCFFEGVKITVEATGRGKCKQTKQAFAAGERKLSATAHTTIAHFKLAAGIQLLRPVIAAIGCGRNVIDGIEGISELDAAERHALEAGLFDAQPEVAPSSKAMSAPDDIVDATPSTAEAIKSEPGATTNKRQPPKGKVIRASGKVCWMFAGHQCFGTLLPKQESASHCYARTHKGNVKTLTKGGTSWWLLD